MLKFQFNKLVRDKIVGHQIASGAKPKFRQLSDADHKEELVKKIVEEAQEILRASPEEVASEIADVQQAVDDLMTKFELSALDIANQQRRKAEKNGTFEKGLFVEYVEIDVDDKWVDYYRKNADRYPEID